MHVAHIFMAALLAIVFYATPSEAVHKGAGDLTCGACHTMHNQQGALGVADNLGGRVGGSMILLRANITGRQQIHLLCLQCHSNGGSQATTMQQPHGQITPKVHNTLDTWVEGTSIYLIGAGGDFYPEMLTAGSTIAATADYLGTGHSLGATNVTPPGGDAVITEFSCTNCHDPHGVAATSATINLFRNLRITATGAGLNGGITLTAGEHTSWVGGVDGVNFTPTNSADGASKIWPIISGVPTGVAVTDEPNSNSYGAGANGISRWCAQCHDDWHELLTAGNYAAGGRGAQGDWNRHPVDNILDEGATAGLSGAGVAIYDATSYDPTIAGQVLPVANAAATVNRTFYIQSATADSVMCLSCHFAHGGPYNDSLRWDYTSAVGAGSQTGNPVASTRGCQLCHNR